MSVLYCIEYWSSTISLSASISRELTRLPLVHCRGRHNRLAGFGPVF